MASALCGRRPTVLGLLLAEQLLDEFFLTVSTTLAGGARAPDLDRSSAL
ncbi:MAG: hypothetical protein M3Y09_13410 [Actinomycetota bacterium]|nr:hypothetical protein [Actinomycetota bacterium]